MMDRNNFYSLFTMLDVVMGNDPRKWVCRPGYEFVKLHENGRGCHKALRPRHKCQALEQAES